jgi:hypothetical protein
MDGWEGWEQNSWRGWGDLIITTIVRTANLAVKMPLRFYNKWLNR